MKRSGQPSWRAFEEGQENWQNGLIGDRRDQRLIAEQLTRAKSLGLSAQRVATTNPALAQSYLSRLGGTLSRKDALLEVKQLLDYVSKARRTAGYTEIELQGLIALYLEVDLEKAEHFFLQALNNRTPSESNRALGEMHFGIGIVRWREEKYREAIDTMGRGIEKLGLVDSMALVTYAELLSANGDDEGAIQQVDRGLRTFPRSYARGLLTGIKVVLLHRLGRQTAAQDLLDSGWRLYGESSLEHFAVPFAALGVHDMAKGILDRVVGHAETGIVSKKIIYQTQFLLGNSDKAISWLEKSIHEADFETLNWMHAPRLWGAICENDLPQQLKDSVVNIALPLT